jgi:hypothetical protein
MEFEKPDTSHLKLKPKEIVPTEERARPGDGSAISVRLIHTQNQVAEEKAAERKKKGLPPEPATLPAPGQALSPVFRPKEITPLDPPAPPGDEDAISVPDILLENRVAEERSGWGRIKNWRKRKSRRLRDFLIIVGGIDLSTAIVMKTMPSTMTMVYGIACITLVTSMSGWIMFFVMDDY